MSQASSFTDKKFRCPLLSQANYPAWKRSIKMQLTSESCWDLVIGLEDTPEPPEPVQGGGRLVQNDFHALEREYRKDLMSYHKRQGTAASIINSTLSSEVESYVKDTEDPAEMWDILQEKLTTANNRALQRTIKRDYNVAKMEAKETISAYLNRLRGFQRDLQGSKESLSNDDLVSKVLTTLPASWDHKISVLEELGDLDLDQLERSLSNYHAKTAGSTSGTSGARAFAVGKRGGRYGRGRGRGRGGNFSGGGGNDRGNGKTGHCWYCLRPGPRQNDCSIKKKADEERKERRGGSKSRDDKVTTRGAANFAVAGNSDSGP
jgi:hypothetical protein